MYDVCLHACVYNVQTFFFIVKDFKNSFLKDFKNILKIVF